MSSRCFICDAPVGEGQGAEVTVTVRVRGTDATTREQVACCDECAARIEARGAALLADVPALTSVTAVYEDGTKVRHARTEASP